MFNFILQFKGEEKNKAETVYRMLGKGLPDDLILEIADVTPEQLAKYKSEYKK